jgi:hypothetical protein
MTCDCSCNCACNAPGSYLWQPTCLRCGEKFTTLTQSATDPNTSRESCLVLKCGGCGRQELLRVSLTAIGNDGGAERARKHRAQGKQETLL